LPLAGQVALTLKTVAGLSTREIARVFLVSEATMGQRLLRTRTKIANAAIAFRVPEPHRLAERTTGVPAVIYLIFNEGYAVTEGEGTADASPPKPCGSPGWWSGLQNQANCQISHS
jgi:RNA polymerase sigma-70 factor (ECF subfamily)